MFKQVHHIGFAVYNLKDTMSKVEKNYQFKRGEVINIAERKMNAVLYRVGETRIEYLAPMSEKSPLKNFLEVNGEGLHHIAYLVDNIEKIMKNLPKDSLDPIRKSDVGNWLIADFKPEYNLLGIKSQLIQEN